MKLKIGITGGIGSGKTVVCKIFESLGIPVYNSDYRAKWLMTNDKTLKDMLIDSFGNIYKDDGTLDKEKIAGVIFSDKSKLELMNSLVHPIVERDFSLWADEQNSLYVIKEAALIFESGSYRKLDYTIEVFSPLDLRIDRVMKRDKKTKSEILKRIKSQMDENQKIVMADFIIINDNYNALLPQVLNLHKFFLIHSLL